MLKLGRYPTKKIQSSHLNFATFTLWMFNSFSQILRKKLNAYCVWIQWTIARLCHVIHSFCLECLDKHAKFARRQLQATIKCPVCQTSFQIPEGDSFKNLPTSYHLNRLVDVLALTDSDTQAQKCSSCDDNTSSSYCFSAKYSSALLVLKLTSAWRLQEVIAMLR